MVHEIWMCEEDLGMFATLVRLNADCRHLYETDRRQFYASAELTQRSYNKINSDLSAYRFRVPTIGRQLEQLEEILREMRRGA